jgi:hypothetical protein
MNQAVLHNEKNYCEKWDSHKVHLVSGIKTTTCTFNVELRALNLSSGVQFFCNPFLVEQLAEKDVCVKGEASWCFWLPLMLMGERAFLNGLCSTVASLLSFVICKFATLVNVSSAYKNVFKALDRTVRLDSTDY